MNLLQLANKPQIQAQTDSNFEGLVEGFLGLLLNHPEAHWPELIKRFGSSSEVIDVSKGDINIVRRALVEAHNRYKYNQAATGILEQQTSSGSTIASNPPGLLNVQEASALVTNSAGQVSAPEVVIEGNIEQLHRHDVIGLKMAEAYTAHKFNVTYKPGDFCDKGARHVKYYFTKPLGLKFDQLETLTKEVLSNAGLQPLPTIFQVLSNNRFEVHIPKPRSEWKHNRLLSFFKGVGTAAEYDRRGDFVGFFDEIRKAEDVKPWDDLKCKFAIDLNGDLIWLDLTTGALIVGAPKQGKSIGMETIVQALCLSYPPEWLEIVGIDFKDGKCLEKFEVFPHFRRRVFTNRNCQDPSILVSFFKELSKERDRRGALIRDAGFTKIQDYNLANPKNPIPWTIIMIDEIGPVKDLLNEGDEEAKEKKRAPNLANKIFHSIASFYRSDGIVLVGGTQYSNEENCFGPQTRGCLGSAVVYKSPASGASLALNVMSTVDWVKEAPKLMPGGDCVVRSDNEYYRAQTLWVENESINSHQHALLDRVYRAYRHQPAQIKASPVLPKLTA